MKIFVTGGSGFIGSNFIYQQVKFNKNSILNYDKLTYAASFDNLQPLSSNNNYEFVKGDICDLRRVKDAIFNYEPDFIVNFAAESHVDRSINDPLRFVRTNLMGTSSLLSASLDYFHQKNLQDFRFLHISTDEVFGSLGNEGFFSESSKYNPNSPYSASKAGSDHLVRSWNKTFGLPTIICNCSNNYGPFQHPEKLIPLMITNCLKEKKLPIYGDGSNIRDWIYVEDHCNALYQVLKGSQSNQTYLIGGGQEKSNLSVVKEICDILNEKHPRKNGKLYQELIHFTHDRPGHDFRYAINFSKIKGDLNWAPKIDFREGVYKTINWYLNNKQWWNPLGEKKANVN